MRRASICCDRWRGRTGSRSVVGDSGAKSGRRAGRSGEPDFALNNVAVQIGDVTALNNLTIEDVQVVNVEDVLNNSNVLNNVLRDANVQVLQDFLNNSLNDNVVIIRDVLSNNLVAISDVIAVNVLSGGDVIVFAQ